MLLFKKGDLIVTRAYTSLVLEEQTIFSPNSNRQQLTLLTNWRLEDNKRQEILKLNSLLFLANQNTLRSGIKLYRAK